MIPSEDSIGLTPFEVDTIDLFVRVASLFGISKSIGEIYGFLFVCPSPVPFEHVRERLRMSSGSASQGLRLLRGLGAVRTVYVAGDRRDHYIAETGLRKLAAGLLRDKAAHNLGAYEEKLARLVRLSADLPSSRRTLLRERVRTLEHWHARAASVLPYVVQALEGDGNARAGGEGALVASSVEETQEALQITGA